MIRRTHQIILPLLALAAAFGLSSSCSDGDAADASNRVELAPISPDPAAAFSGDRAHGHIARIVEFGPRPPGSEGLAKTLDYLEATLADFGWTSRRQSFRAATPEGPVTFTNLIARHTSAAEPPQSLPVVLGGHIDSKKLPFPFVGANDSGSSTGVMLEIARVLAANPESAAQVELAFFDGEEAFRPGITPSDGLYGSKHFAHELRTRPTWPALGIVIDIIGDPEYALQYNPEAPDPVARRAVDLAGNIGFPGGFRRARGPILDDHVPLQNTGLPCLHLIGDFQSMPYWHQPGDTLDKVSPDMLGRVGELVLRLLAEDGLLSGGAGG